MSEQVKIDPNGNEQTAVSISAGRAFQEEGMSVRRP